MAIRSQVCGPVNSTPLQLLLVFGFIGSASHASAVIPTINLVFGSCYCCWN